MGDAAEAPVDGRFVVVTVTVTVTVARSAGGAVVERVMDHWAAAIGGTEWWAGNEWCVTEPAGAGRSGRR